MKFRIKYGNSTGSVTSFVDVENNSRDYTGSSAVTAKREQTNSKDSKLLYFIKPNKTITYYTIYKISIF